MAMENDCRSAFLVADLPSVRLPLALSVGYYMHGLQDLLQEPHGDHFASERGSQR
jgi:hypothetical protein